MELDPLISKDTVPEQQLRRSLVFRSSFWNLSPEVPLAFFYGRV